MALEITSAVTLMKTKRLSRIVYTKGAGQLSTSSQPNPFPLEREVGRPGQVSLIATAIAKLAPAPKGPFLDLSELLPAHISLVLALASSPLGLLRLLI